ncbi:hypothetical protein [Legionella sp.]|uniref:hypothetical protein n=1 Tax=Legionella sp. TaxID=459 RepID=UPI00325A85C7
MKTKVVCSWLGVLVTSLPVNTLNQDSYQQIIHETANTLSAGYGKLNACQYES